MNMTDPVADMLTRIRNAAAARHTRVLIPASKMKLAIARVLKEEGYIKDIEILKDNPQGTIRITLRYVDKKPVLTQLKRVSKPGLRVYTKKASIPRVRGGKNSRTEASALQKKNIEKSPQCCVLIL